MTAYQQKESPILCRGEKNVFFYWFDWIIEHFITKFVIGKKTALNIFVNAKSLRRHRIDLSPLNVRFSIIVRNNKQSVTFTSKSRWRYHWGYTTIKKYVFYDEHLSNLWNIRLENIRKIHGKLFRTTDAVRPRGRRRPIRESIFASIVEHDLHDRRIKR